MGHDCSVGNMLTSVELTSALQKAGHDGFFHGPEERVGAIVDFKNSDK